MLGAAHAAGVRFLPLLACDSTWKDVARKTVYYADSLARHAAQKRPTEHIWLGKLAVEKLQDWTTSQEETTEELELVLALAPAALQVAMAEGEASSRAYEKSYVESARIVLGLFNQASDLYFLFFTLDKKAFRGGDDDAKPMMVFLYYVSFSALSTNLILRVVIAVLQYEYIEFDGFLKYLGFLAGIGVSCGEPSLGEKWMDLLKMSPAEYKKKAEEGAIKETEAAEKLVEQTQETIKTMEQVCCCLHTSCLWFG